MKQKLRRYGKWVAYPLFYVLCLALFGILTFPYDQLKDRLIAEFDRMQAKKARRGRSAQMRLEIDELDGYWISGIEVTGARLIIPPKKKRKSRGMPMMGASAEEDKPEKPAVIAIDYANARVQMLPLLIGNVTVKFDIEAFAGEIEGSAPLAGGDGEVELELEGVQLSDVTPLKAMLEGVPLLGVLSGKVQLQPKDGKFSKSNGKLEVRLDDVLVGDGKTKVQGVALPAAHVGAIVLDATAKDGVLTIDDFSSNGRDLELIGEGKVRLSDAWDRSQADVYIKFKFADGYRDKTDAVKGLLGDSEGKIKPLVEAMPGSPFKRAKTDDGYYRFHLGGPLGKVDPKPAGKWGPGSRAKKPGSKIKRPSGFKMPRKPSPARKPDKEGDGEKSAPQRPKTDSGEGADDKGADDKGADDKGADGDGAGDR